MHWLLLAPRRTLPTTQAKQQLTEALAGIQQALAEMHAIFAADSEEVQREWVRFTARVDKKVEGVLHHAVKRSLQELNRLLNGDSKTEVLPVFRCCGLAGMGA